MENNAPNLAIKKQEKLLQEISQLEKQTSASE